MKTVILVHGIRTRAWWQGSVAALLCKEADCNIIPIKYGYFDLIRFLCPFGFCRQPPIDRVHREIRNIQQKYPDHELFVIAHSFGTYAVSRVLHQFQDIAFDGLIFCGSIVPPDFPWDRVATQLRAPRARDVAINECGTRDVWPPLAQSVTWGYGSTGTYGFGTLDIQDRVHRMPHSGYFEESFVRTFWVPFINDRVVVQSATQARGDATPGYFWLFNIPLRWVVLAVLTASVATAAKGLVDYAVTSPSIAPGAFECQADDRQLKSCSVSKTSGMSVLSFDGPDAAPGRLIDRYTGPLVADGISFVVRLANQFDPNPQTPGEAKPGPNSELRLSPEPGKYVGSWTFEGRTPLRFTMSKKEATR
jgi:pimeloyl-ACP methyl ester carboxylesterase